MLRDSRDMPKFQTIQVEKSIRKYGGNRMYFAPPMDYDKVIKQIPYGKVITVGAKKGRTNFRYFVKEYEKELFVLNQKINNQRRRKKFETNQ